MEPRRLNIKYALEKAQRIGINEIIRVPVQYDERDLKEFLLSLGKQMVGDSFVIDQRNSMVYDNFRKWCDGNSDFKAINPVTHQWEKGDLHKGIYIAGPTGTGKSVCTNILRRYVDVLSVQIIVNRDRKEDLTWKSYRADEICQIFMKTGDLSPFLTERCLCIQDIFSEPEQTIYMGNKVEVIRNILEYRGDRKDLITIITANDDFFSDFRYGDRARSRLFEMCNYYEMLGKDRRVK